MREPERFTCGDTLLFEKCLPAYTPAEGWSMEYVLTSADGNQKATVLSAESDGNHRIYAEDWAAAVTPGAYVLSGFVVNGAVRHQVYYSALTLTPDLVGVTTDAGSLKTEAEEFIEILRVTLKDLYKSSFRETDVQKSKFIRQKMSDVREELAYWKEMRVNEIQCQRARNGRPTGAVSLPVFMIS